MFKVLNVFSAVLKRNLKWRSHWSKRESHLFPSVGVACTGKRPAARTKDLLAVQSVQERVQCENDYEHRNVWGSLWKCHEHRHPSVRKKRRSSAPFITPSHHPTHPTVYLSLPVTHPQTSPFIHPFHLPLLYPPITRPSTPPTHRYGPMCNMPVRSQFWFLPCYKRDPTVSRGPLCHMLYMHKVLHASSGIPTLTLTIWHMAYRTLEHARPTDTTGVVTKRTLCVWLFPCLRGFWENFRPLIPRPRFFLFFFKFHSLCQDHSTVAQRAETTVAERPLTSCVWARFRIGSHTCLDSGVVSPLQLRWVKSAIVFRRNLSSALLAEWPGLLRATVVIQG